MTVISLKTGQSQAHWGSLPTTLHLRKRQADKRDHATVYIEHIYYLPVYGMWAWWLYKANSGRARLVELCT